MLFAEVAEQMSFAKAAEKVGISKGHLSEQIKKLESDYDTPLLVRTTRNLRLTDVGHKALQSMRDVKHIVHSFEQNLQRLDGTIRITAPRLFAETFLSELVVSFCQQHPNVTFEIDTSYALFNLNQSNFDMAFRATQESPPENMIAKKLFSYQHTVAASPRYIDLHGKPGRPAELTDHSCLTASPDSLWQFRSEIVKVVSRISSNDNLLLKQLAIGGEGIIRLPGYYLETELKQNRLQSLLQDYQSDGFDLYLLYPTATRETARLRLFTSFVIDYFTKYPLSPKE